MWNNITTIKSSDENVLKTVFEKDNAIAEAVLYKYPTYEDRTVICCSVMSGCPIGCRFCGSGDYFVRNLTAEEIVEQVTYCILLTDTQPSTIKKLQVMMMSMGEPMLNKNIAEALRVLYNRYPNAQLLISTSAPDVDYEWFIKLSEEIPTIGLQFSIHESTDEARDKLIPFKKKLTLKQIADVGKQWYYRTGRTPFFNYCVHDANNKIEDAIRIANLFNPIIWNATLSVICERNEHVAAANQRQHDLAANFAEMLMSSGFNTRMFNPAGQDDIGGGCGQLWYVQDWMKQNPTLAKPSIGHGIKVVHTPCDYKNGKNENIANTK